MEEKVLSTITDCPDCVSSNIVYDRERDQIICRDCGSIFEQTTVPSVPVEKPKQPAQKAVPKKKKR